MHLVSKLRHNSALYFRYEGTYSGRGPHRKYGEKLDYKQIPEPYLKASSIEKDIETKTYQMPLWHKKFAELLHVGLNIAKLLPAATCLKLDRKGLI